MITFLRIVGPDERPWVMQNITQPSVYLDTWAIRLFAEDDAALGARFRNALRATDGTLVLSHLSIAEFTFEDPRHARAAGRYIDTLLPHVFCAQFDPFRVIHGEIPVMVRQTRETPAGDLYMLTMYADVAEQLGIASVAPWFNYMHTDRANIQRLRISVAQEFLTGIDLLLQRLRTAQGFAKQALRDIRQSTRPRATQALLRAILYRLRSDPNLKLSLNDALDLMHCIVPAAYCDFVLLDRAWAARLQDATKFLQRSGIETRIAQQFTRRDDGVKRFLETLEAWPSNHDRHH